MTHPHRPSPNGCRTEDHPLISRRGLLQVGGMSLIGMGLSGWNRMSGQVVSLQMVKRNPSFLFFSPVAHRSMRLLTRSREPLTPFVVIME